MRDRLLVRAAALARGPGRRILGITGCPGAGKTALARWLAHALADPAGSAGAGGLHPPAVVRVPMDGFHLADAALERLGRLDRKGAIDTFDGHGYLALLRRLRAERDNVVWAPEFQRTLEQPIAGSIAVPPQVTLVLTEGNYLLSHQVPWSRLRAELDEVWYVELPDDERRRRLVARHMRFGKQESVARAWVDRVDEANAALVAAARPRADVIVDAMQIPYLADDGR